MKNVMKNMKNMKNNIRKNNMKKDTGKKNIGGGDGREQGRSNFFLFSLPPPLSP